MNCTHDWDHEFAGCTADGGTVMVLRARGSGITEATHRLQNALDDFGTATYDNVGRIGQIAEDIRRAEAQVQAMLRNAEMSRVGPELDLRPPPRPRISRWPEHALQRRFARRDRALAVKA